MGNKSYYTIYIIRYTDCVTVVNPITSSVLTDETTLINPKRRKMTFTPLEDEEFPKEGDIIGLDAEFVSLNQASSGNSEQCPLLIRQVVEIVNLTFYMKTIPCLCISFGTYVNKY